MDLGALIDERAHAASPDHRCLQQGGLLHRRDDVGIGARSGRDCRSYIRGSSASLPAWPSLMQAIAEMIWPGVQ